MRTIRTNSMPRRRLAAAIAVCFALTAFAAPCFANYDDVTNCNDSGGGSLRDTIANAASGDTVVLNPVTMQCSSVTLGSGEIMVPQNDLTVKYNGPNPNTFILTGNEHRIFHHTGTGKLTLQRLTLEFGKATDADSILIVAPKYGFNMVLGGCVYSAGVVDLEYTQVKYCSVATSYNYRAIGGGIGAMKGLIMNGSTLRDNSVTVQDSTSAHCGGAFAGILTSYGYINANYSTVRDNTVGGSGGGLCIHGPLNAAGKLSLLQHSTISGNTAGKSSAIFSTGELTIVDSTISGNVNTSADDTANTLSEGKTLVLRNSTIAFNRAARGAAIGLNNPMSGSGAHGANYGVDFESSIVANNTSNGTEADIDGSVQLGGVITISGANNIIMSASTKVATPGDTLSDDPLLLPLSNNGGPTQTHAFREGSPAFGAGNNSGGAATDQRGTGFLRTINGRVDIGAYEAQSSDVIFANGFD